MLRLSQYLLPTIGLAAIITSCSTVSDIDRGIYGVTNQVSTPDLVTGQRTINLVNREALITKQNAAMDAEIAERMAKGEKFNSDLDAEGYARLQKITARILSVSHFADEKDRWKVYLLPDEEWNAFVNGGTYIMVYKGFLDSNLTDDEMAAVIGHEIGHLSANHIGESHGYQTIARLAGSDSANRDAFQASFNIEQEREADRIGILYAALAGYDPNAASQVWQKRYKESGNYGRSIKTHPLNSQRMSEANLIASKVAAYYEPSKLNPEAKNLLTNNVLWQQQSKNVEAGSGGGLLALVETVGNAYIQRENAKSIERQQQMRIERIAIVEKLVRHTATRPLDGNKVAMGFIYQGGIPLKKLSVAAITKDGSTIISDIPHPVAPRIPFTLIFEKEGLGQTTITHWEVDDAEW